MFWFACMFSLQDQLVALQQFYNQTNGSSWHVNRGWNETDVCKFFGVICNSQQLVESIKLPGNKIVGSLPDTEDFKNLLKQLKTIGLNGNPQLSGFLENLTDLQSLMITETKIKIIDLKAFISLNSLNLNFLDFKSQEFPLPLSQFKTALQLMDCGFVFPEQKIDFKISTIYLANNDMSKVTATFPTTLSRVDLTNTKIQGVFDMQVLVNLREVSIAGSNLIVTFAIEQNAEAIDIPHLTITTEIVGLTLSDSLNVLNMRDNLLQGFFTIQQAQEFKKAKNLYILELSNNAFLCNSNSQDAFECTFLAIQRVLVQDSTLQVQFTTQTLMNKVRWLNFTVHVRDSAGSTDKTVKTIQVPNCQFSIMSFTGSIICKDYQFDNKLTVNDVAILYRGAQVSTGSLMVLAELEQELQNLTKYNLDNLSYSAKRPAQFKQISEGYVSLPDISQYKSNTPLITLEVVGVSRCPDYNDFWVNAWGPFSIKYPQIASLIDFKFVSLSRYSPGHITKSFAMHGQAESLVDLLTLCIQKQGVDALNTWSDCFNEDRQINDCMSLLGVLQLQIQECYEFESEQLLDENLRRIRELHASWSPSVFVDDQLVSLYHGDWALFADDDPDSFKEYICTLPKMEGKC